MQGTPPASTMPKARSGSGILRMILRGGWPLLLLIAAFAISVAVDRRHASEAEPPASVGTLEDFHAWMTEEDITARGEFTDGGVTYTVMLSQRVSDMASGPAAYVFDPGGAYVDWTPDMGDIPTKKHRFDLTSGKMKVITIYRR